MAYFKITVRGISIHAKLEIKSMRGNSLRVSFTQVWKQSSRNNLSSSKYRWWNKITIQNTQCIFFYFFISLQPFGLSSGRNCFLSRVVISCRAQHTGLSAAHAQGRLPIFRRWLPRCEQRQCHRSQRRYDLTSVWLRTNCSLVMACFVCLTPVAKPCWMGII